MQYTQSTHDINSLVKKYTLMPGLVLATVGGYAAFTGAFNMFWDKWLYPLLFGHDYNSWLANIAAMGSILLPCALYIVVIISVMRYYKRRFGQVKPRAEETKKLTIELIGAAVAYFFVGENLDIHLHPAVSITLLMFALFLFIHWLVFARALRHYLLLAAIAVILSFVPLFNSTVYSWLYTTYASPDWCGFNFAICSGLLLLIAGLLDHWYMLRMFTRVRKQVLTHSSAIGANAGFEEL